ncbi:MAG: FKBP-type peptidyl-prolyl cis-trans isomerase [Gammaproteobacteria bacterium]|nr:FKBP-type peptidyl-prolyl cis-trans isomerase [Gammaproteobacteria bacterium]MDH5731429.1 FKBP-type peptidyl-prolyl cis-trans isomerase [Gammaproteobacteria bacterium]
MKRLWVMIAIFAISMSAVAGSPKTEKDKFSYFLGMQMAMGFQQQLQQIQLSNDEYSIKELVDAAGDVFDNKDTKYKQEELQQVAKAFQDNMQAKMQAAKDKTQAKQTKIDKNKLGYFLGMQMVIGFGQSLNQAQISQSEVETKMMLAAAEDLFSGKEPQLSDAEVKQVAETFQTKQRAKMEDMNAKVNALADENKEKGKAFLTDNKKKKGVVELDSGLQYKVITKGKGKRPGPSDQVVAHYRGTLLNGEEFDSSYSRGEPTTFPVGGVIKGWTEALQLMKVGAKWQLFIPSDLAYGDRGTMGIAPGSTLIFDVELVAIK